jgi:hypothetical protein
MLHINVENHTILLIGGSHARGITERLATNLRSSYCCTGYVKPNADLNTLTSTRISEVKTLNKNDDVIIYGGAMDIARNTMNGLSVLLKIIKNSAHTNVILLSALQRFGLSPTSCVNKEMEILRGEANKLASVPIHNIPTIINGQVLPLGKLVPKYKIRKLVSKTSAINNHPKEHNILLLSDSHGRGCSERIKNQLSSNFEVCGFVKPCVSSSILTNTA